MDYNERDELVKQIIEAGQELIDRAESLVGPSLNCITGMDININLGPGYESVPEITVNTKVLRMNTLRRWQGE